MTARRIIPIRLDDGPDDAAELAGKRLESAGFMPMMLAAEPRLSELVEKFKLRGYEVEVLPYEHNGGTIYVRKQKPADGT